MPKYTLHDFMKELEDMSGQGMRIILLSSKPPRPPLPKDPPIKPGEKRDCIINLDTCDIVPRFPGVRLPRPGLIVPKRGPREYTPPRGDACNAELREVDEIPQRIKKILENLK